jgi:large subunit ribosomal protein L29
MNLVELRKKSEPELNQELLALLREQFNLRVQRGIGQTPSPHLFGNLRKQIARIKTIISEKEGAL